jgi:hypothetical protein
MTTKAVVSWEPGWEQRLVAAARKTGAASIGDFLSQHHSVPYFKLVRQLGDEFAAVQLQQLQFAEAEDTGQLRAAAADGLCRILCDRIKRGWGRGMHFQSNLAGAYAEWLSLLEYRAGHPELRECGQAVWQALVQQSPPEGWLPTRPDDPLIVAAFTSGWPA